MKQHTRVNPRWPLLALFALLVGGMSCGGDDGPTEPPPPANQAPQAVGSIEAVTVEEGGTTTVALASSFSDPDGDALTYTAASSNAQVATVTVSGSDATVSGVSAGTASVTVTATDPGGLTATQNFAVTVEIPNRAPEAVGEIDGPTITAGDTFTIDVAGNFSDPDGDALTYSAASSDQAVATAAVSGSNVAIAGVAQGSATVTVTASDPDGLSATQDIAVTVREANSAPEPVGTIPAQATETGMSLTVDVAEFFTDPDGDALTFTAASAAEAVATTSVSGSEVTVAGLTVGMADITVTAADIGGLTATQSFTVHVAQGNRAPVVSDTLPDLTLEVGAADTSDVASAFSDPDGDELTLTVSSSNTSIATATLDGTTLTITAVAGGVADVSLTATDPGNLIASQTIRVSVQSGFRDDFDSNASLDTWEVVNGNAEVVDGELRLSGTVQGSFAYAGIGFDTIPGGAWQAATRMSRATDHPVSLFVFVDHERIPAFRFDIMNDLLFGEQANWAFFYYDSEYVRDDGGTGIWLGSGETASWVNDDVGDYNEVQFESTEQVRVLVNSEETIRLVAQIENVTLNRLDLTGAWLVARYQATGVFDWAEFGSLSGGGVGGAQQATAGDGGSRFTPDPELLRKMMSAPEIRAKDVIVTTPPRR